MQFCKSQIDAMECSTEELNALGSVSGQNVEILQESCLAVVRPCGSSYSTPRGVENEQEVVKEDDEDEDEELRRLLLPKADELPSTPPSAVEAYFATFFAPDFLKPGHDQYIHRHANGLCVIGLASSHVAFKDKGGITSVDFNVGKSDRSEIKVTGKRKKNAKFVESNTALCKVHTSENSYIVRCCIKGSLLEVNERLIKQPELLNSTPDREGYIAIIMPKPAGWLKAKASLLSFEDYKKLRTEL